MNLIEETAAVDYILMIRRVFSSFSNDKAWHTKFFKDPFVKQSWKDSYRSRAAYKLIQMNDQLKFLDYYKLNILELGCYPGSWSQVIQ